MNETIPFLRPKVMYPTLRWADTIPVCSLSALVLARSSDAEFFQIIVSAPLKSSRKSNATGCTLSLRPLMDPHQ